MAPPLMKQFQRLLQNVDSFSDHQVEVLLDGVNFDAPLETFNIRIRPNDGPYRGGTFEFLIFPQLGGRPPDIVCETTVYHPNIDPEDHNVCVNLLEELWSEDVTLEDVVQGLLFLFYNPCIHDPYSFLFSGLEDSEDFVENVRKSLRGETVCGFHFERNLIEEPEVEKKVTERRKSYGDAVCVSGARLRRSLFVGDRPHNDVSVQPGQRGNTAYFRMESRVSDTPMHMHVNDTDSVDSESDSDVQAGIQTVDSLVPPTSSDSRDLSASHNPNDTLSTHSYETAACGCRFAAGSVTEHGTDVDVCEGQGTGPDCRAKNSSGLHDRSLEMRVINFFSWLFGRAGR